jgi:hypothetical protein
MFIFGVSPGLFTELDHLLRFDSFVARTALGVKERQNLLKRGGIRHVPQERAFTLYRHEVLVLELLQMMR